jgi:hypothetical protein
MPSPVGRFCLADASLRALKRFDWPRVRGKHPSDNPDETRCRDDQWPDEPLGLL